MPDISTLPYLLQLLDDQSDVVRNAVARELAEFGPALEPALSGLSAPPSPGQRHVIRTLLADYSRRALREVWPQWYGLDDDYAKLETALSLIADFQNGPTYPVALRELLDKLAAEFRATRESSPDPLQLAQFLFSEKGLTGERNEYYHPSNSNLVYVIEARRGLPISLSIIYMLVGRRLGMTITGCAWPRHFFARVETGGTFHLVDCFSEGHAVDLDSFLKMQGPSREAARSVIEGVVNAELIIIRVLNNLIHAYAQVDHAANRELFTQLLRDTESGTSGGS